MSIYVYFTKHSMQVTYGRKNLNKKNLACMKALQHLPKTGSPEPWHATCFFVEFNNGERGDSNSPHAARDCSFLVLIMSQRRKRSRVIQEEEEEDQPAPAIGKAARGSQAAKKAKKAEAAGDEEYEGTQGKAAKWASLSPEVI